MDNFDFAPRMGCGDGEQRLQIELSAEDQKKIGRGARWQAKVTDLKSGKRYFVRAASCGSAGCYCDAVATELPESERSENPELLEAAKTALSLLQELALEYEEGATSAPVVWPQIGALATAIESEERRRAAEGGSPTRLK
jgi:hypothetical protein